MPRANRYFIPGHVWHITHRCHQQEFLLKFARDRKRWRYWLFEAKKRYGLCVLNYIVTSNHIHLLVQDTGNNVIPNSMQLIAGRVAQEYNLRKKRKGAFWEDRYHATAIETDKHLIECMVYIDLNMVRAGIVSHPSAWLVSGFVEIQNPNDRYKVIDTNALLDLMNIKTLNQFQGQYLSWVTSKLNTGLDKQDSVWSNSLAVGSEKFVSTVRNELGYKAKKREIVVSENKYCIKEEPTAYTVDFDA